MADERSVLHYGSEIFHLADDEDGHDLADRITAKITASGGWVDVVTKGGGVRLLMAPGIPIWLDNRNVHPFVGASRRR